MIRILVADDHVIARKGLKQIVDEFSDIVVSGEAANAQEVFERLSKKEFDLVVLDVSLPGMSGIEVLKQLHERKPKLPVLVLSMHPEEQYALRAIKAGASGYLTKESAADDLIKAIRKVAAGRKYISPTLAERLVLEIGVPAVQLPHEALSDREYQVLCLIASGKTAKQIAKELFLSPKTIGTYRMRILQKMQMKSNAALTYYAIKNRLVD